MSTPHLDFVDAVALERDLVVTYADRHHCRIEPRVRGDVVWHCEVDDGTTNADDKDPPTWVRWVCPELRVGRAATGPVLAVSRPGDRSDLARLARNLGRLLGRAPAADETYAYTDPDGVLDEQLRGRIEHWPAALHDHGVLRPAELSSLKRTGEGLVVSSTSWWDSAPALAHQLDLAVDIARRVLALG